MAPLGVADLGARDVPDVQPPTPPSPRAPDLPATPDQGDADEAAQDGQQQADHGRREAGAAADDAQRDAAESREQTQAALDAAAQDALARLMAAADAGQEEADDQSGAAAAFIFGFLATAERAAHQALSDLVDLVLGRYDLVQAAAPPMEAHAFKAQGNAAPAPQVPLAAAVALVVAAGAVGGALVWWTWLHRAVSFGLLPLLSRIARSELYTNDARRLIADLAAANPGMSLNELVTKTGYSRNAVSYHLFVLEKEEELISIKDGKYRRYFPRGGKYVNGAKNVVSALRNETSLRMAQRIAQQPGLIQRELCKELGTTPSAACWHARRLEQLGVIRKHRVANTVQYYPGEALNKYDLSEFGLVGAPASSSGAVPAVSA